MNFYIFAILSVIHGLAEGFVVHEWGTFTSLVGSNGKAQLGMHVEDEKLPKFVHNFGDARWPGTNRKPREVEMDVPSDVRNRKYCFGGKISCELLSDQAITQKMETPVVYFYSKKPTDLRFEVWFPRGIISQSYPIPDISYPIARPGSPVSGGYASYDIKVLAEEKKSPPTVRKGQLYNFARNTKANWIEKQDEVEKFIFYRGLGEFEPNLMIDGGDSVLTLESMYFPVSDIFVVHTEPNGKGNILSVGSMDCGDQKQISSKALTRLKTSLDRPRFLKKARGLLLEALVKKGLYRDEAIAMLDTWEHGYFQTAGLRVLYVLDSVEVNMLLPIRITPNPDELKRAFVGRIEVLTKSRELLLLQRIHKEKELFPIQALGKLSLAALKRLEQVAKEEKKWDKDLSKIFRKLTHRLSTSSFNH